MKRILAGILAAALALSATTMVMASDDEIMLINEAGDNYDTMLISETEDEQAVVETKTTYTGIVEEVGEGFVTLKDQEIQINIDNNTYVADYDLMPYEGIKAGDEIVAIANIATTRSIPAQTYGSYILVKTAEDKAAPVYATVASNDGEVILSADGNNKFVLSEETEVTAHKIRIALRAEDITAGSEIFVNATVVGLSLPAHVVAEKITVMKLAEATVEETTDEPASMPVASGPVTTYGVVESVSEEGIALKDMDLVLKTDANTYIADYDLMPYEGIKAGDEVVAVIDEAMTMSIPAQSYAHYILVKTTEDKAAPIYVRVASNNGSEIMSADNNNKIVIADTTEVTAHKIKIALRAEDITVGSDLFVNATVVGMSIPAHVVADKITVMKLAAASSGDPKAGDVKSIVIDGVAYETSFDYFHYEGDAANSTSRIPLRKALEDIGFEIGWNGEIQSVSMTKDGKTTELSVAPSVARGIDKVSPIIFNDRTYVTLSIFNLLYGENADVKADSEGNVFVTTK